METTEGDHLTDMTRIAQMIQDIDALAGLNGSGRLSLAESSQERHYAPGQPVVCEGDPAEHLYLLLEGSCEVSRSKEDSQESLAVLGPGQTFGEMGLLYQRPRSATVTCLEPTKVLEIPREALDRVLTQSFHIGLALEQLASSRIGALR